MHAEETVPMLTDFDNKSYKVSVFKDSCALSDSDRDSLH